MSMEIIHPDILSAELTYNRVDLLYKHINNSSSLVIHPYKKDPNNIIIIKDARYKVISSIQEKEIITFLLQLNRDIGLNIKVEIDQYKSFILVSKFTEKDAEKASLILRVKKGI